MKVSGFTIVRNVLKYDYPIVEAILSVLDCVDEMVVAVGASEDETRALIESIQSDKIRIVDTVWDDSLRKGGAVLADETNKAIAAISPDSDWCFYIQADEVLHEQFIEPVKQAMKDHLLDNRVEGLLFDYTHFYGSYQYVGDSRAWYRKEIRIIRNLKEITSYKDAQGFRYQDRKLNVVQIPADIYHYGWVKNPHLQQEKQKSFHKLWHVDEWLEKNVSQANDYDYKQIESLELFTGTHPEVMKKRILRLNWDFFFDTRKKKFGLKKWILHRIEKLTGIRLFEYKNYKMV